MGKGVEKPQNTKLKHSYIASKEFWKCSSGTAVYCLEKNTSGLLGISRIQYCIYCIRMFSLNTYLKGKV